MWKKLNIFKAPIDKETLDDWAKIALDCAKVSILAIPVLLYGNETAFNKLYYSVLLAISAYCLLFIAKECRSFSKKERSNERNID